MEKPKITILNRYVTALKKLKKKYVTADVLSREVGVYPEIISEAFSYFDPIIKLDYQYNLMDILDEAENYITNCNKENKNSKSMPHEFVTKRKLDRYDSIGDFIYKKMTIGGLLDTNIELTDIELRALKRLINEEQAIRKQCKVNKTKKILKN